MKLDSTRVNETIDFIANYPGAPLLRRKAVAQFCRETYPKLSLLDFGPYSTEFETLSNDMSVKQKVPPGIGAGDANQRAMRRAIFLIWQSVSKACGMETVPAAQVAMTMATGGLIAKLDEAILKGAVCASPAGALDVFINEFAIHPANFLRTHKVIVLGTTKGGDKFTNLASASYDNVVTFYFQYDAGNDRFLFNSINVASYGAAHPFSTVSVPAVAWYDVPGNGGEHAPAVAAANFSQILGCELTGADFMVTTQFTGCTFCWTSFAGVVRAAHIGPTKPGSPSAVLGTSYPGGGNGVAQRMMNQGNPAPAGIGVAAAMANAAGAPLQVFGRGAGNAPQVRGGFSYYPNGSLEYATIIGRKTGPQGWRFYLQSVDGHTRQIHEGRRIF